MERNKGINALSRKQLDPGKILAPIMLSNSTTVVDTKRKFTKKDLEEACRKHPSSPSKRTTVTTFRRRRSRQDLDKKTIDSDSQVQALDAGVKLCARKYNECKAQGDKLEAQLKKRQDELAQLMKETTALQDMIVGNNMESQKIERLRTEINETTGMSEYMLHYRLQLNHMHHRVRKNSVSLDAYMNAMSETLSSAEKEKEKCERMLGEVESGLRSALRELEATTEIIEGERAERQRALNSKKLEAGNAERLDAWRQERESSKEQFERSIGGASKLAKERRLRVIRERQSDLKELNGTIEKQARSLALLEEEFIHIKQATGVNSLPEMVEKFATFKEHRDRLLLERKEAEERLSSAKKSLELVHEKFDRVKAAGFGDTELNRGIIKNIEEEIEKERSEGKIVKSTNAKLESELVGLRQGGMGLYQRLIAFHPTLLDGDAPDLSESVTASAIQAAHETLEMLKVTEQILGKMLDSIGGIDRIASPQTSSSDGGHIVGESVRLSDRETKETIETIENPNLGDNNCRIKAKPKEQDLSSPAEGVDVSSGTDSDDADSPDRDNNMTRTFLKKHSQQQASAAQRRARNAEKRRKMMAIAMSDEKEDESSAAIRKKQAEAVARMAQHIKLAGLPKALTMRDDPMTKAQAFLSETPYLE